MHANYLLLGLVAGVAAAPLPAPDVAADTPSQGDVTTRQLGRYQGGQFLKTPIAQLNV
ncbi:hypothetical protein MGG_18113 [Pyricularia oryzae 70-15]|uniref:Uncharacterized protein n=3 Tax=Pyricularia oryzae TaxID=318829 RepID=A0A151V4H7_PYRO7|nr:uncharacterized protein MGG_18113 [Pyricularia oryzae 70-15]ELQ41301.1 hypothetical protein OOU_Y34scaffold00285g8 [Pyricularia oryzae Y34]KYQ30480.1 hypothetical protein MGG_18113 [Pyricularia oryzae 70-15]